MIGQKTAVAEYIHRMKYRLEGESFEECCARVAGALKDSPEHFRDFVEILYDQRFLPGGRIQSAMGSPRGTTAYNCFVSGIVEDSMSVIMDRAKEAAETMRRGGGIGYDFSRLRPRGDLIMSLDSRASGPVSYMGIFDAICQTIASAGHRRGAQMAVLRIDHPDVEIFLRAKQNSDKLTGFNISLGVTDDFMKAVLGGEKRFPLKFEGRVYKYIDPRALWDQVMRSTWDWAEPGVLFLDTINRENNLHYCETLEASNPCITADSWVQTTDGPRQVADLVGRPFEALVDGAAHASGPEGFFPTGRKTVLRLTTREGFALRLTADHKVRTLGSLSRSCIKRGWTPAGELAPGDLVVLHDHRSATEWPGLYTESEGYLLGLLVGDGTLKSDKAVLSAWPGWLAVNGGVERPGVEGVMAAALAAARGLPHRADFAGWIEVPGRGEYRLALAALRRLAVEVGMTQGDKCIAPAIESASSDCQRGFLRGLFDADGSVLGNQDKGVSIRLTQNDTIRLAAVQRMLLRFGIVARVYRDRRPTGMMRLPDGRGSHRDYPCKAVHELVIANENIGRYADLIGFSDTAKQTRLAVALAGYRRALNRERFVATVDEVTPDGDADVFDVSIPGINAFDANGIYVHNCAEQPLPPYGACLLGSFNLVKYVNDGAFDGDRFAADISPVVRAMDNVVDRTHYPLKQQQGEAINKRRMGLGITGLANAAEMLGMPYGSREFIHFEELVSVILRNRAYTASISLADEKGAFPAMVGHVEEYLESGHMQRMPETIRSDIRNRGIRNSHLTSIAPTGTISLTADNVSSGIEPPYQLETNRIIQTFDGPETHTVKDYAWALGVKGRTANEISAQDHLSVLTTAQKFVDSAISKTCNVGPDVSFDEFSKLYTDAWLGGAKGLTTFRANGKRFGIFSPVEKEPEAKACYIDPETGDRTCDS